MNRLVVIEDHEIEAFSEVRAPAKKSILTIGGCNSLEVFNQLVDVIEFTHFWRAAVPTVMSPPIELQHAEFESEEFSRLLNREASKIVYKRIIEAPNSIIVFEAASDFVTGVLKIDDTIISDIRNEIFNASFKDIVFNENSQLSRAKFISTDSQFYWDNWKHYFDLFYQNILKERIRRGVSVLFLSRRCCTTELKDGEFVPLPNARIISARNRILDEIDAFISCYEGVKVVKSELSLEFTSDDAPWGGPWEFHPQHAYYADLRAKFLDAVFPEQKRGAKYLANWIAEITQSLSKTKAVLNRIELEALEAISSVAQIRVERDLLVETSALAQVDRAALEQKLQVTEFEIEQLRRDRDIADITKGNLQQELDIARGHIKDVQNALEAVQAEKAAVQLDLESIRGDRDTLSQRLEEMAIAVQGSGDLSDSLREELLSQANLIEEHANLNLRISGEISYLRDHLSSIDAAFHFASTRYSERSNGLLHRLARRIAIFFDSIQLRKSGFSEDIYLEENSDVRDSGMNALTHYVMFGMRERRRFPTVRCRI
ncbi:hypothetical protein HGP17_27895 [Rhizobium sp. P38BS-XIX]|uniref:hypothetical protein n=1 Tax=Rhizobium sp. P38BS-XIX TaxID=2726740 RepID=UPI00145675E3|nr:hypothetical protein [Rhizobium sp. P38BS-XIX]NLS00669.1 hypothetical protein [Rhizobium sp. P38BS-XIX]